MKHRYFTNNFAKFLLVVSVIAMVISRKQTKKPATIKRDDTEKMAIIDTVKADTPITTQPTIKATATLFAIEGQYQIEKNNANCKLDLTLYYKNNRLMYKLTTNTRKMTDSTEIYLNEDKNGYYITLKNIEWSENEGALADDGTQQDPEVAVPKDIQGVLYKNELVIQNTGNSMNYYVKFGECDLKFIHLIKR